MKRLLFELKRRKTPYRRTLQQLKKILPTAPPAAKFSRIKKALLRLRFPLLAEKKKLEESSIYLNPLPSCPASVYHPASFFRPRQIIVEKDAAGSYLEQRFRRKFPSLKPHYVDYYSQFLKNYRLRPENFKEPLVFIIKEHWDFIKPCPCTPKHLSCGYWILNLGLGCPFDCSYCYLQQYQNFPGLVLPSNVERFCDYFENFFRRLKKPIRIGTGEFCDSLALDDITLYTQKLVTFFSRYPVFFELKTKSDNISHLLTIKPAKNIIISWTLSPPRICRKEEIAAASLEKRLNAAEAIQRYGYSVAFHFDPIIYYPGWEKDYLNVVRNLYRRLKPPFAWISLGTLRANRRLKTIVERRFPHSNIFYSELILGEDKKLRYPKFLRVEIYRNMVKWIREHDKRTPLYLCMEDTEVWHKALRKISKAGEIEDYLVTKNLKLLKK